MSDVRRETDELVREGRELAAHEAARVLRDRSRSFWPVRTGLSLRSWRGGRDPGGDAFTVENRQPYARVVEARNHTYRGGGRVRHPAFTTIRQNLQLIARRVDDLLERAR
ncbi:MAG: hypothetical protein F4103_00470 [Boseongicola sp. SB0673_bin_14]|nr:hypothetical protein [Boseongicola sp. SB0673_bin_14]